MPQLNWTYYSLSGLPYRIEMYHGDDSGHLILFVNGNITQISFNQTETKTYSFLIEQQLLEFKIVKENEEFTYTLTPQPIENTAIEEKTFDKHFWIPLILLLVILNLVFYLYKSLK